MVHIGNVSSIDQENPETSLKGLYEHLGNSIDLQEYVSLPADVLVGHKKSGEKVEVSQYRLATSEEDFSFILDSMYKSRDPFESEVPLSYFAGRRHREISELRDKVEEAGLLSDSLGYSIDRFIEFLKSVEYSTYSDTSELTFEEVKKRYALLFDGQNHMANKVIQIFNDAGFVDDNERWRKNSVDLSLLRIAFFILNDSVFYSPGKKNTPKAKIFCARFGVQLSHNSDTGDALLRLYQPSAKPSLFTPEYREMRELLQSVKC